MSAAPLFLQDPYARSGQATVTGHGDGGAVFLDAGLFYATGGGQPGDSGTLSWVDQSLRITEAVKSPDGRIALLAEGGDLPPVGTVLTQAIDWDRRLGHMRVHTALHLLSVVIPLPVMGGAISEAKGRVDFRMPDTVPDKAALQSTLQGLIDRDLGVTDDWISDAELDANPALVKTMSVKPPRGAGQVRLVRIGTDSEQVDLQACGGTHVARTGEIGKIRIGKIEKKNRDSRRVYVHLDD
ncbi:alanyl-tRNA editing protein [Arenibacterium sp. CAU 1754]